MTHSLYNYMPLKYFKLILENGLYFRFQRLFRDKCEGYMPKEKFDTLDPFLFDIATTIGVDNKIDAIKNARTLVYHASTSRKNDILVNCWHQNSKFSRKMWESYASNGVYIKTTSTSLISSIPKHLHGILEEDHKTGNLLHEIEYVDNHVEIPCQKFIDITINKGEHDIKLRKHESESEHRLIIDETKLNVLTGSIINKDTRVTGLEEHRIELEEKDIILNKNNGVIEGLYLKMHRPTLIEEIGIVGEKNLSVVQSLSREFNINPKIRIISEDYSSCRLVK
ncbi:hypothetical protein [Chromohalobacter canadensis]|uniref:DUF2971 domain-containing protein n=1 Tax=Chromohalobacter canadensis TaxID=141389 RepID=A0ABZ0YB18_9GAMM|nr:hypothetical protein [Chromohalobacter canadensis]MCK0768742.1 hypothetical protein [Chromohalobacter canadensis]WQH09241.1 hypothetical protein SR908_00840 [Chromohalobacter canadensis]